MRRKATQASGAEKTLTYMVCVPVGVCRTYICTCTCASKSYPVLNVSAIRQNKTTCMYARDKCIAYRMCLSLSF